MIDPVAALIFAPWLIGPLLAWLFPEPPISQKTADGFTPVDRKLMRMQ
jgi:hypothetical protein